MNIIINIFAAIGLVTVLAVAGAIVAIAKYDPTADPESPYYRRPVK